MPQQHPKNNIPPLWGGGRGWGYLRSSAIGKGPIFPILLAGISILLLAGCIQPPAAQPTFLPTLTLAPAVSPTAAPLPSSTPLPTPAPSPTPVCLETGGLLESHTLEVQAMSHPLPFQVYLPPCYDPLARPGYPSVYLLHGQSDTPQQWLRIGLIEAADALITSGHTPPFIIVLPQEVNTLANPFDSGFEAALPDELIPWVEANYAACPQRACRAIGGISRGGAWALHIGLARAELFAAIGGHSAPPFYGSDLRLPAWLEAILAAQIPRIGLDVGESDRYRKPIEELHQQLLDLGVAHDWRVSPGDHSDAYWSAQVEDYLRWYFPQP